MSSSNLKSRFTGALMGTFVGDALGMPFEGQPARLVASNWNDHPLLRGRPGSGIFTDDTEMMVGLAESLIACGGFDGEDMARRFVGNYDPSRGYGAGAHQVLRALREGVPWQEAATVMFPEGSFGNGAAMRVAPIGVFYHHDPAELRRVAELSASITHAHPLGKEGAALQAYSVACAARLALEVIDPPNFLAQLRSFVRRDQEPYAAKLAAIGDLLPIAPSIDEVVGRLGNDVRAQTAVPAAVYAFLSHSDSFPLAVEFAVRLGGDTDTIGAMTGAIAGAYHGLEAIPAKWLEVLENTPKGRDYVLELAARLYERHLELKAQRRAQ